MAKDGSREFQEVIDRLKAALGLQSNKDVAERLGLTASNLGEKKTRGALPRAEIDQVCVAARLSPDWVYEGRGEMLAPGVGTEFKRRKGALQTAVDMAAKLPLEDHEKRLLVDLISAAGIGDLEQVRRSIERLGLVTVPRFDVSAAAGAGSVVSVHDEAVVDYMAFKPEWLRAIGVASQKCAVISVKGDSMATTLDDGDLILVDTSIVERKTPGVYVIARDDTLLVKRLNFKVNGSVEIASDNKAYPTETLSRVEFEQLHLVGRMVRRVVR